MKNKISFSISLLILGYFFISCTCENFNTTKQEYDGNEFVVTGTVLEKNIFYHLKDTTGASKRFYSDSTLIKDNWNLKNFLQGYYLKQMFMDYSVKIIKKFKGRKTRDTVIIRTGMGDGDCGYHFEIGKSYLIFGTTNFWYLGKGKTNPDKIRKDIFLTSQCQYNQELQYASSTIEEIKKY